MVYAVTFLNCTIFTEFTSMRKKTRENIFGSGRMSSLDDTEGDVIVVQQDGHTSQMSHL